jgi:hypothetical protein
MGLLLAQALGQAGHLVVSHGAEPVHFLAFGRQQAPEDALAQAAARAARDRGHHVQVVQQQAALVLGAWADRVAGFEKQQWRGEHALADGRQPIAPGGVELADLAVGEALAGDGRHQALTRRPVGARQGDQVLHGRVRGQRAAPDVVLDRRRQLLDQRQPPAHPAPRAREAPPEIVQRQGEAAGELVQQPPLLQRRGALAGSHQPVQHQRLRLGQIPARGRHQVLAEPAQRPHPLVAVHEHEALGALAPDDHHGDLLADVRQ